MFERFTEKAIKSIMLAQEEARMLGHNFVGTEQILLGLIGEGTGIAAQILKSMGITLKDARIEVEKIIGRGSGFVSAEIPFTPRAKRIIELSWDAAQQFGHNYVGTEHLLLGIIREGEGVAPRVLQNCGLDLTMVRDEVLKLLGLHGVNTTVLPLPSEPVDSLASSVGTTVNTEKPARSLTDSPAKGSLSEKFHSPPPDITSARYSEGAMKVILNAQDEARRLGRNFVSGEQLLLGLIVQSESNAAKVLAEFGVNLENARVEVEKQIGPGSGHSPADMPFSSQGNHLLETSWSIARRLGDKQVDAEHLLLAILFQPNSIAVTVLKSFNVSPEAVEEKILNCIATNRLLSVEELQARLHPTPKGPSSTFNSSLRANKESNSYGMPQRRMSPFNPEILPLLCLITICIIVQGQLHSPSSNINVPFISIFIALSLFFSFMPTRGVSMVPTICDGDIVVCERLTKLLGRRFRRGEIVSFCPDKHVLELIPKEIWESSGEQRRSLVAQYFKFVFGTALGKRIVGLPGEHVQIIAGQIYINGKPLKQVWARGRQYDLAVLNDIGSGQYRPFANSNAPIVVPPDHYFVLGDNLSINNLDSHIIGFVSRRTIAERLCFIFWRNGKFPFLSLLTNADTEYDDTTASTDPKSVASQNHSSTQPDTQGSNSTLLADAASSASSTSPSIVQRIGDWLTDEALRRVVLLAIFLLVPLLLVAYKWQSSSRSFDDCSKMLMKIDSQQKYLYNKRIE